MSTYYGATLKNDTSLDTGGTSVTFSHDNGSGSDRVSYVYVCYRGGSGHTVSGVTINSVSMDSLGARVASGAIYIQGWKLENPASGSQTVSVQHGGGAAAVSCCIVAISLYDNDQSTIYENYTTASGADASSPIEADITVTSATGDLVIAAAGIDQNRTWTVDGTGQVDRASGVNTTDGNCGICVATGPGAASVLMELTANGYMNYATLGLSTLAAESGLSIPIAMSSYKQQ